MKKILFAAAVMLLTIGGAYAQNNFRGIVKYKIESTGKVDVKINKAHWDYTLLPVWVLTYKDRKGKDWRFSMNGDTGKAEAAVVSDLTVSIGCYKNGFFQGKAPDLIGGLVNVDIGIEFPEEQ